MKRRIFPGPPTAVGGRVFPPGARQLGDKTAAFGRRSTESLGVSEYILVTMSADDSSNPQGGAVVPFDTVSGSKGNLVLNGNQIEGFDPNSHYFAQWQLCGRATTSSNVNQLRSTLRNQSDESISPLSSDAQPPSNSDAWSNFNPVVGSFDGALVTSVSAHYREGESSVKARAEGSWIMISKIKGDYLICRGPSDYLLDNLVESIPFPTVWASRGLTMGEDDLIRGFSPDKLYMAQAAIQLSQRTANGSYQFRSRLSPEDTPTPCGTAGWAASTNESSNTGSATQSLAMVIFSGGDVSELGLYCAEQDGSPYAGSGRWLSVVEL